MGREPGSWGAAGLWSKRTHPGQRRPRPLEAPDPQPLTPESRAFTALLLPGTRGAARGMVWTRQAEETSTAAKVTLQAGPTAPSTLSPVHEGPASPAVIESLRRHYVRTLLCWHDGFEKHLPEIEKMFNERFIRMWRMYLCSCAASFNNGVIDLHQILFTKGINNDLPMTRRYQYNLE